MRLKYKPFMTFFIMIMAGGLFVGTLVTPMQSITIMGIIIIIVGLAMSIPMLWITPDRDDKPTPIRKNIWYHRFGTSIESIFIFLLVSGTIIVFVGLFNEIEGKNGLGQIVLLIILLLVVLVVASMFMIRKFKEDKKLFKQGCFVVNEPNQVILTEEDGMVELANGSSIKVEKGNIFHYENDKWCQFSSENEAKVSIDTDNVRIKTNGRVIIYPKNYG